jgi:transposase
LLQTAARRCRIGAIATFAQGLEQYDQAIRAALTTLWSNVQAEGQITRLKLWT